MLWTRFLSKPDSNGGDVNRDAMKGSQYTFASSFPWITSRESSTPPLSHSTQEAVCIRPEPKQKDHVGASGRVRKVQIQKKSFIDARRLKAARVVNPESTDEQTQKRSCFLNLPGEIRNLIYDFTFLDRHQALVVHRPRLASLRASTRTARGRPLVSDMAVWELEDEILASELVGNSKKKTSNAFPRRENNRPYVGLTQVCRKIRQEYRPLYLLKQEIGIDLTSLLKYLHIFYPDVTQQLNYRSHTSKSEHSGDTNNDFPYTGNITIAISDLPNMLETAKAGVEVYPFLELWANSFRIEAGFGRYHKKNYQPLRDGEARDLYRLFGRRVLDEGFCSQMNENWRRVLRQQELISIRIHRQPHIRMGWVHGLWVEIEPNVCLPDDHVVQVFVKPYIEIVIKKDHETKFDFDNSTKYPSRLLGYGFENMEFFELRAEIESDDACMRRRAIEKMM